MLIHIGLGLFYYSPSLAHCFSRPCWLCVIKFLILNSAPLMLSRWRKTSCPLACFDEHQRYTHKQDSFLTVCNHLSYHWWYWKHFLLCGQLRQNVIINFMALFYQWGLTASRLQSHSEEAIHFLPESSQKFLVLIWLSSKGWKAESTLKQPNGFEHRTLGLGIQCLNH